ncbi:MAG TPA: hypothetical protein VIK52_15030 [Opitutaceae bacterium]
MKRIFAWTLVPGIAFAAALLGSESQSEKKDSRSSPVPIQELIVNPLRYNEREIKTIGFLWGAGERGYFLVSQREAVMVLDVFSRITLGEEQLENGEIPSDLDGKLVYIQGRFVVWGKEGDPPGLFEREIKVTYIKDLEMDWEEAIKAEKAEREKARRERRSEPKE